MTLPADMAAVLPELTVAALVLVVLALDVIAAPAIKRTAIGGLSLFGVLLALALALARLARADMWMASFSGALVSDPYARLLAVAVLTGASGVTLLALGEDTQRRPGAGGTYQSLILTSVLGMLVAVGADDLLVLGLSLATVFLPIQVLSVWGAAAVGREAGLRLGQLHGLAWGLYIAGMAVVWAAAGTVDYGDLAPAVGQGVEAWAVLSGVALILAAGAVLAGTAPLHTAVVDAHQGSTPPVGALLAACAIPATLAGLARLLIWVFAPLAASWGPAVAAAGALAALSGAALAAVQTRLRRLMAALVCAHGGAVILAIATGSETGLATALFLLFVQTAAVLGLAGLYRACPLSPGIQLRDLGGLARRHPILGLGLACCAGSLVGLPPTAGFAGRLLAYKAAAATGLGWPLGVVVISQLVGGWVVLRLMAAIAGAGGRPVLQARVTAAPAAVMALAVAALLALGLCPEPLLEVCRVAADSLM